jgi:hypothetical protein
MKKIKEMNRNFFATRLHRIGSSILGVQNNPKIQQTLNVFGYTFSAYRRKIFTPVVVSRFGIIGHDLEQSATIFRIY